MRDPDKGYGFLNGHILTADIACPYIADALLAFQIILCDMFHSDSRVFKMFDLSFRCIFIFLVRIENNKNQHEYHDEYIDDYDPGFFHRFLYFLFQIIGIRKINRYRIFKLFYHK